MQILVTGGLGYIGSHSVVELINADYEVVIVDDLSNSEIKVLDQIEKITDYRPKFYEIDMNQKELLETVFQENKIAAVLHFAGFKAAGESVSVPLKYYRNNIVITLNLLELMQQYQVATLVFSSSATVYGDPTQVPILESESIKPTNPYGQTKAMIETILKDLALADESFKFVSLRYFNPIGAHQSGLIGEKPRGIPNNLLPYVAQVAVLKREYLNVWGNDYPTVDGTGVRDYIHVVDLAQGHIAALDYALKHPGIKFINLGTGSGHSVLEIVETFTKVNQVAVPYQIKDRRPGDIAVCYAETSYAKELLGWEAKLDLKTMCQDLWHFYQKEND